MGFTRGGCQAGHAISVSSSCAENQCMLTVQDGSVRLIIGYFGYISIWVYSIQYGIILGSTSCLARIIIES